MISGFSLPSDVPLFPLEGALLLPRSRLPLQVFEPRYLAMVEDCLKTDDRILGLIQPKSGGFQDVGCAGRIVGFTETDDGRYMITLLGMSRFQISDVREGFKPYLLASASWGEYSRDLGPAEQDQEFPRDTFLPTLKKYFKIRDLETDWSSLENAEDELLINSLSMLCPFEPKEKQLLLEAQTLADRRQTLQALLEMALHSGPKKEQIQ
ncbi:LON peptidase substrate-binding domain-containing protein [Falsihalocynthiibacter sp. SS001]|uniref:LON peptidase substrate-binding domain-containing protein n=1 Tax=Falsihalocynthiibacter sp. SS001 TaxID=3349698 RepID=UPI0036D4225C